MNFKKIFLLFLILCLFLTAAACTGNTPGKSGEEDLKERVTDGGRLPLEDAELAEHQPHHILLKGSIDREVENFLEKHRAEINDDMSDLDKNIYRIRFPEEKALTDKIEKLRQFSAVAEAEPNYKVNKFPVAEEDDMVQKQSSNLTGTEDKYAGNLWGIAAVNAVQAWNSSTGEDVVIALIDTGVEEDHPDLSGKVLEGFNVFKNNTETEDFHDHGTHVAGTAAAKAGGGVVGVAKDADILPIKVFHEEGHPTYTFEIARGINWLTDWAE